MAHKSWDDMKKGTVAALRLAYYAKIDMLAERLRPRFERGALFGFHMGGPDECREDAAQHPALALEDDFAAEVPDFATAYLILACSPSEDDLDGSICLAEAKSAA